ncbi:MAG: proton-conducting transporter membrane subunit, partial [Acidobacteriota bacterium]
MVGAHRKYVSQLDGLGWRMPFTFGAFLIGSLSIIGIPPFAGAWSKWWLAGGALEAENFPIVALYMVSSLLAVGYLMPVVARAFATRPDPATYADDPVREPWMCVLPPVLTAFGCLVIFFGVDPLVALLEGMLP